MITNDAELAVVQEQLNRLHAILAEFRRDVLPLNRRNYRLLTESYVEMMYKLRAEIDAYFEVSAPAADEAT